MQVARWGNSLAIRLPVAVVRALDLHEGDEIAIEVTGERRLAVARQIAPAELVERLRKFEGRLPADFRFDQLAANSRWSDFE